MSWYSGRTIFFSKLGGAAQIFTGANNLYDNVAAAACVRASIARARIDDTRPLPHYHDVTPRIRLSTTAAAFYRRHQRAPYMPLHRKRHMYIHRNTEIEHI